MKALIHVLRENQRHTWRRIRVCFTERLSCGCQFWCRSNAVVSTQLARHRLCGSYYSKIHRERRAQGFVVFAKDDINQAGVYCNRDSGAGGLLNWKRILEGILRM